MRKKILLATKNQSDTTSYLRAWGAFTTKEMKPIVEPIRYPKDPFWVYDWTYYREVDAVYLHRPSNTSDFHIIERCKQMGKPLWIDFDDDLENVGADNPCYSHYADPEAKHIIRHAMKEADILTVGGKRHQARLTKELEREVILIPNAVDDELLSLKKPFKMSNKIAWRGSESHRTDLLFYQNELTELMDDYDNQEWTFFGLNPFWLSMHEERRYQWIAPKNLFDYYIALTSYNASLHMVPLVDTEFNRVKSNLAWSDATLAGSVAIVPDLDEYEDIPGVFRYVPRREGSFTASMKDALTWSEYDLNEAHRHSYQYLCDNILMSKINQKRIEILRNL